MNKHSNGQIKMIKHRLAHFDGKPLAYSFESLEDCLKTPARDGLFIIAYSDTDPSAWYITHHGTRDMGWVAHTLAQTITVADTPTQAETKE